MDDQFLVVGGGIGGLTTAIALALKKKRVRVLEQAPEFQEVGAGIQLGPNVIRMLDRLGLADRAIEIASLPDNIIYRDAISGDEVTRVSYGPEFRKRFGYPYALIHRADLLQVFLDACEQLSDRVVLETSAKVVGFSDLGSHVVVETEAGASHEGLALIGCDGLRSLIRSEIVSDGPPRNTGQVAYRAVLAYGDVPERLRPNDVVLWGGPGLHLAHYPLRNNTLFNMGAIFHSARYEEGRDVYGDPEELHQRFEPVCADVKFLLGKIETWRRWSLFDREPIEAWSKGRTTLLGDAAHPMLQYLAQGAGMAIEDAVVLADEVAKAGTDIGEAFGRYEKRRYLRTGRVQITSRYFGDIFHAAGVMRTLRNQMLKGRSQAEAHDSLEWLYAEI